VCTAAELAECADVCGEQVFCSPDDGCIVVNNRDYGGCRNYLNECTFQTCVPGVGCVSYAQENYAVRGYVMYSNARNWVLKRVTLMPTEAPAEETLVRGESDDIWIGVAFEPNTNEVYVAELRGAVYQRVGSQLVLRHNFDVYIYDISAGPDGSVWLMYLDGDLQMLIAQIDFATNQLINVQKISSGSPFDTPTASFAWDRYGYYAYFQMEGPSRGFFRYDPITQELTQLCNQEYASHGMFLNFAGEAYIGRNHDEGNLDIPLVAVSPLARACNETEIVYQPATNFQAYKFDAAEVCLAFVAPEPLPPAPLPPPPPPPPPVVPVPEAPVPVPEVPVPQTGGGGGSGGSPQNDNTIVESAYSSLAMGGAGAAVVGCFALFAVVVGMNNTKKDPAQPAIAVLVEDEMMNAAADNPVYHDPSGPNMNVLNN